MSEFAKHAVAIGRLKSLNMTMSPYGFMDTTMDFAWILPKENYKEVHAAISGQRNGEFYLFGADQLETLEKEWLSKHIDRIITE